MLVKVSFCDIRKISGFLHSSKNDMITGIFRTALHDSKFSHFPRFIQHAGHCALEISRSVTFYAPLPTVFKSHPTVRHNFMLETQYSITFRTQKNSRHTNLLQSTSERRCHKKALNVGNQARRIQKKIKLNFFGRNK